MALNIQDALRTPGEVFPFDHEEIIPAQDILGDTVTFDPAVMKGTMCLEGGRIRLSGRLTTTAHGSCAMCLEPAQHKVNVRFDEVFHRRGEHLEEDEDQDESDRFEYEGPQLAVDRLAMTLAVLALPMRLLCEKGCPGIQVEPHDDQTHAVQKEMPAEHPFSALQQLLNKDQEV